MLWWVSAFHGAKWRGAPHREFGVAASSGKSHPMDFTRRGSERPLPLECWMQRIWFRFLLVQGSLEQQGMQREPTETKTQTCLETSGNSRSCPKLTFTAVALPLLQGLGSKGQVEAFACFPPKLEQTDCLLEMIGRITPVFEKERKENPGNYRLWDSPLCLQQLTKTNWPMSSI